MYPVKEPPYLPPGTAARVFTLLTQQGNARNAVIVQFDQTFLQGTTQDNSGFVGSFMFLERCPCFRRAGNSTKRHFAAGADSRFVLSVML